MIDVVYIFQFENKNIEKAIKRARCSIQSLKGQDARIVFLNYSKKDCLHRFKDLDVDYHHIPFTQTKPWNKSILINYGVKNYVQSLYFFLSDIDIVYPPNYIKDMLSIGLTAMQKNKNHVRVVPMVAWLQEEHYSSNYEELKNIKKDILNPDIPGLGIGLFNTASFKMITGFNESWQGWGHEDVIYNSRVSKINTFVVASNVLTYHLYHVCSKDKKKEGEENKRRCDRYMETLNSIKAVPVEKALPETINALRSNSASWGELSYHKNNNISICIPAYEMGGYGVAYLTNLINSIAMQSFKDYEIVISDHSQNKDIELYCQSLLDLPIRYYRYDKNYGNGPANTNNAIRFSKGKYIKPMFQDDCFTNRDALKILYKLTEESKKKWIVCSSGHIGINGEDLNHYCIPRWHKEGMNSISMYMQDPYIGSPSRVMWLKDDELLFDTNLVHYMDVEMWFRVGNKYDEPIIFTDKPLVSCRQWKGSVTNLCEQSHPLDKEREYLFKKFGMVK